MNSIIKNDGGLTTLIHGANGITVPKPYERDILLFETYVAGTVHIENIDSICNDLKIGDNLKFLREPNNKYDKDAIMIKTENNVKIGYVPKNDNIVFSRLMDAGKFLFGKIKNIEIKGKWHKIDIEIFLHE